MIDVLFVMDGPRDHATIPHLVGRLLGVKVRPIPTAWKRLRQKAGVSGYRRQLQYLIREARDASAVALIATVDKDKEARRQKLRELLKARDDDRASSPAFPTALGEAAPHGEAWLLDDPVAVRRAFGLESDYQVPNVVKVNSPKDTLEELKRHSNRAEDPILEILTDIAKLVDPTRCVHAKETGFHGLLEEVRRELAPVTSQCGEECRCGDVCERS
jgi:hypothetical protein